MCLEMKQCHMNIWVTVKNDLRNYDNTDNRSAGPIDSNAFLFWQPFSTVFYLKF